MKTKSRNLISVTLVTTQCLHTIPTIPEQRLLRTILLPTMMVDSAQHSNLTNSGLLTIGRHYTLTGSSAFLYFGTLKNQDIGTVYTEMHHKSKKALDLQGLLANF